MSVPTNDEALATRDRLDTCVADDLETQWLEFEPWQTTKGEMRVAVEYAVAFANAEGGVIVLGIADKIRGWKNAIHGVSGYDLDVWRRGIYDSTCPGVLVEIDELQVPEGKGCLLVVRTPKGPNPPYGTARGLYKVRVGKDCMPMDAHRFFFKDNGQAMVLFYLNPAQASELNKLWKGALQPALSD